MQSVLVTTALLVMSLVAAVRSLEQIGGSTWSREAVQCVADDFPNAVARLAADSDIDCSMRAGQTSPSGVLVAQYNRLTRACTVFNYQSVCRDLVAGQSPNCAVFGRFPINRHSLNPKLTNVWLGDAVSRLENLVCQADEDTNRLHPVGVQWNSEGAVFDGIEAHAVLNKSSVSFAEGLTWLLRIKRQPRVQSFFDLVNCTSPVNTYATLFWEFSNPRRMYARPSSITGVLLPGVESPTDTLPSSSEDWINIGFTSTRTGDSCDMFFVDSFLPRGTLNVEPYSDEFKLTSICMHFGMRLGEAATMFKGTLRALAFASASMTEAVIREFFSLIDE